MIQKSTNKINIFTYLFLLFSAFLLLNCSGDIKNERIGLYVLDKGLQAEQIRVFQNQQLKVDRNINFGQQLTIEVSGIDDFEVDANLKVLPGGENAVADADSNVIYHIPDYFQKYAQTGVTVEAAKAIKFNLTIGKPMERGKSYQFLFRVWDKRTEKELKGTLELNVI